MLVTISVLFSCLHEQLGKAQYADAMNYQMLYCRICFRDDDLGRCLRVKKLLIEPVISSAPCKNPVNLNSCLICIFNGDGCSALSFTVMNIHLCVIL